MKPSKHPIVNLLVLAGILGMIASVALLWHASEKAVAFQEPYLFASSDGKGVVFNIDRTLYRAAPDGRVEEKATIASLGLDEPLSDIQIAGERLWVLEGGTHRIKSCPIPLQRCQSITEVKGLQGIEAMDLAVTPDENYLYVTLSRKHRIDKFAAEGDFLYTLTPDQPLQYPNDIIALETGHLVVADTNNHRVVILRDEGAGRASVTTEIAMEGDAARHGYHWPTAVALDGEGRLWVLNQDGFFDAGDIVRYPVVDPQRVSATPFVADAEIVPLPDGAKPGALGKLGAGIVAGDAGNFDLLQYDALRGAMTRFSDPEIASELLRIRQMRDTWASWQTRSQGGIAFFIVLLVIAAAIEYFKTEHKQELFTQPERYEEAAELTDDKIIAPDARGVIWLAPKASIVKKLYAVSGAMAVMLAAVWGLTLYALGGEEELLYMLGILTALTLGIAWLALAVGKQRIGIRERQIWLVDMMRKQTYADVRKVLYTGRRVIIGDVAVGVYDGRGNAVFDEAQFSRYVLPLLKEGKSVNETALYIGRLKEGDPKTWLGMLGMGIAVAVLFWLYTQNGFPG